jgi:hypothetical protein
MNQLATKNPVGQRTVRPPKADTSHTRSLFDKPDCPRAIFSADQRHRFALFRGRWDISLPLIAWIGFNPSTADSVVNDNTIDRVIGFSFGWGFKGIVMLNLFSYRATHPKDIPSPVHLHGVRNPENDRAIVEYAKPCKVIVAAWGAFKEAQWRAERLFGGHMPIVDQGRLYCLGRNKNGSPRHPLFLAANTPLERFAI